MGFNEKKILHLKYYSKHINSFKNKLDKQNLESYYSELHQLNHQL